MASQKQIAANRRNAEKSTGPRTTAGRNISRFNGLKSGIDAESQVIPGESAAELAALAENYRLQFQPANPLEMFLVDSLVDADWQLRRLRQIEARFWKADLYFEDNERSSDRLARVQRRIQSVERSFYRALKELQLQIAERSESEEPEPPAEPAAQPEPAEKLASVLQVAVGANAAFESPSKPAASNGLIHSLAAKDTPHDATGSGI
jgi:hypothetical protein